MEYRIYKKSIDFYRIEKKIDGKWVEIEKSKGVKNLLLENCQLVVDEHGRKLTLEKTGIKSEDVPVHAWIECEKYEILSEPNMFEQVLYYNPYTVKKFVDRKSYEENIPVVINKVKEISINGNFLTYKNPIMYVRENVLENNLHLLKK